MSGHGGDEFFKFQDSQELSAIDIGNCFRDMEVNKRYREVLFIIDTCQASTLTSYITSSSVITIASSKKGENSFSHVTSTILGVSLIDRFTYSIQQFFDVNYDVIKSGRNQKTIQNLIDSIDQKFLKSTITIIYSNNTRKLSNILITDFFAIHGAYNSDQDDVHNGDNINVLPL
jgi:phosphatidylinositol glycan class K